MLIKIKSSSFESNDKKYNNELSVKNKIDRRQIGQNRYQYRVFAQNLLIERSNHLILNERL